MHCTLRQLDVFQAVARHLSFTRAAAELHLSQPAVSMQVKQLEANIDAPLFEQLGKRLYLTEVGRELFRYSRNISQQLEEADQVINEVKGTAGGRLKVAVASTVNYFATRLLGDFCQRFPQVQVRLEVTNREGLLNLLENNGTDIVLMGRPPDTRDLVWTPFMENPLVVIAPPGHRLTGMDDIPLSALRDESFLLREAGSGTRTAMERFFTERDISFATGMEMNTNEAIKQGVEAGLGLGVVSLHTVGTELETGQLKVLNVESFPIRREWYVVYRRGKRLPVIAQAFMAFLLEVTADKNSSVTTPEPDQEGQPRTPPVQAGTD
ncbi:MAG: LysR substrate-binding domain-containing protein [Gammaproteobacteria bacterium]|nr:LysR substrate-binding domain-containing protein [Gammaproteobacteria bacterium]